MTERNRPTTLHAAARAAFLLLAALVAGGGAGDAPHAAYTPPQVQALTALRAASRTPVHIRYLHGFPVSVSMEVPAAGMTPVERARNFLTAHGDLYLQDHPDVQLIHSRTITGPVGDEVRFVQVYKGLPVFGGEVVVRLSPDATGAPVVHHTSANLFVPARDSRFPGVEIPVDVVPAITAAMAEDAARTALGRTGSPVIGETILMIHDPGLGEFTGAPRLVWRVSLGGMPTALALVDANDASLRTSFITVTTGAGLADFDLDLEHANGGNMKDTVCFNPTTIDDQIGDEDGLDPAWANDSDASIAWHGARETYLRFHDDLQRHSYDDDDGELEVYVHANLGAMEPNASGTADCGIEFSNGWPKYDVIGHEVAHMVIDETSNLLGAFQPGALNESFSDLMGVMVDPDEWLMGEWIPGQGPFIRNLANPARDTMSDYVVQLTDNGGVHGNSTIVSKAFYLMSVGGTFNNVTVAPMGFEKMKRLAYWTFTLLPAHADFAMARDSAVNTATMLKLLGLHGFNDQDICTTRNAFNAVEIGQGDANCDGVENNTTDTDGDGILDDGDFSGSVLDNPCPDLVTTNCDDNCRTVPNPDQADFDGSGGGDLCDLDDDNDGWPDAIDNWNGPGVCLDTDSDGEVDCSDPDDDNDGIPDDGDASGSPSDNPCPSGVTTGCDDNCRLDFNPTQFDGNNDGDGDACDPDVDGDGHYPPDDNCPLIANAGQVDDDSDGLGNACDKCPDVQDNGGAYTPGIPELGVPPEPLQPDSDGDGIPDACDPIAWFDTGVLAESQPYAMAVAMKPDRSTRTLALRAPVGGGSPARLPLRVCDTGQPEGLAADERFQLSFTGLPSSVDGWVENGWGDTVGRIRVSRLDPTLRGLRFRPRCAESYRLVLTTDATFDGEEIFTAVAEAIVPAGENPWTSNAGLFRDPPPLPPDRDRDGLWDDIDNCPDTFDPAGQDLDEDGVGDVCDTCPDVFNPGQGPVEFQTVVSDISGNLSWPMGATFDFVSGPLTRVSSYTVTGSGFGLIGTSLAMSREDHYYLLRLNECGTWGSAARDAALP